MDQLERLHRQKLRQRAYRARRKQERRPTNEDLARAVLDVALTVYLKAGRHEDLLKILDRIAGRLQQLGFEKHAVHGAWFELQDRYEGGWSMLRQRYPQAELEARMNNCGDT